MQWFKDLSLSIKIYSIVVLSLFMFLFTFLYSLLVFNENAQDLEKIENEIYNMVKISTMNDILLTRTDELYTQAVTFSDEDTMIAAQETYKTLKENIAQLIEIDQENTNELNDLNTYVEEYNELSSYIVVGMLNDTINYAELPSLGKQKADVFDLAVKSFASYKETIDTFFIRAITESKNRGNTAVRTSFIFGIVMTLLLLVTAITITRNIILTVNRVRSSLLELAEGDGDLKNRIDVQNNDELGKVAFNFNNFMDTLMNTVKGVVDATGPLKETSQRLIETSEQSRAIAAEQTQNSESAQQAMNEFNISINEVAESANSAKNEGHEAEEEATLALAVVKETISNSEKFSGQIKDASEAVSELAQGTDNVGSILEVITTISDQTNLLALNAAIEAARAGEHGRGFAVVADEVRTLATKTADATTEIFTVLESLRSSAKGSVTMMASAQEMSAINEGLAQKTGDALESIRVRITSMSMLNTQVATATEEQSQSVIHVSRLIDNMAESTKKSSSSVSVLDSIAQEIGSASDELTEASGKFHL